MEKKIYEKSWFIILLLIVFFPVGLFLMWKYTDWGKGVKWTVTGILAILVVANMAVIGDTASDLAEKEEQKAAEQEKFKEEQQKLADERKAEKEAKEKQKAEEQKKKDEEKRKKEEEAKALEEKEKKEKEEREKLFAINKFTTDDGVTVFQQFTEPFSVDRALKNFSYDMANELKANKDNIKNGAVFRLAIPLTDTYGNESNEYVLVVYYEQDTIDKINIDNWPTLDDTGLYDTADGVILAAPIKDNKVTDTVTYDNEAPSIYYTSIGEEFKVK